MIDLSTCPNCQAPLIIDAVSRAFAVSGVLVDTTTATPSATYTGTTDYTIDPINDTEFYECRTCYEPLPDAYQATLDALLHPKDTRDA